MDNLKLEELEEGDRILFNDRSLPCTVEAVDDNRVHVKGPRGGEYIMFYSEDTEDLLFRSKKSPRRYASYVENLREIGRWKRVDDKLWRHSKTGANVEIVKNDSGFWSIETSLDLDEKQLDLPKYGFSDREFAVEYAEEITGDHPEGL